LKIGQQREAERVGGHVRSKIAALSVGLHDSSP
jgi:hypothetical protein